MNAGLLFTVTLTPSSDVGAFDPLKSAPLHRRAVRAKLRKRLKGALEFVYDNYYSLVIGFGPSERPSEAIFSIVLLPEAGRTALRTLRISGKPSAKYVTTPSARAPLLAEYGSWPGERRSRNRFSI